MVDDDTPIGSKEGRDAFLRANVSFPEIPTDENPEDSEALRLIMTGQEGQGHLLEALAKSLKREKALLARMLRRDWEKRFPALITEGRRLLAKSRGVGQDELGELEARPSLEEIGGISAVVNGGTPVEMLELLGDFARRCFVCGRLIPWKAEAARIFKFFADCVEAEDLHVELLAQLTRLVGDEA